MIRWHLMAGGCAPRWSGIALLILVLPAGCARFGLGPSVPASAPAQSGEAHARAVSALTQWRLRGRIGVQRDDTGFSGSVDWRQDTDRFEIRIGAPLNGGTFVLSGAPGRVVMLAPDGKSYTAPSARILMATHLGWSMPLEGANAWVRGIPAAQPPPTQALLDDVGRWTDFAQDGWRISVLDYRVGTTPSLPRKLFMSRDTLKVRLVIEDWELP